MAISKVSDEKTWEIDVVNSPVPVFVDFWAEWCGPCRMVGPVVEELSGDYDGKIKFVKVNIDEANALASVVMRNDSVDTMYSSSLTYRMAAGTTSSTTFKIRIGSNASGTIRLNGVAGQLYGGVLSSTITIFELDI